MIGRIVSSPGWVPVIGSLVTSANAAIGASLGLSVRTPSRLEALADEQSRDHRADVSTHMAAQAGEQNMRRLASEVVDRHTHAHVVRPT